MGYGRTIRIVAQEVAYYMLNRTTGVFFHFINSDTRKAREFSTMALACPRLAQLFLSTLNKIQIAQTMAANSQIQFLPLLRTVLIQGFPKLAELRLTPSAEVLFKSSVLPPQVGILLQSLLSPGIFE